MARQLVVLTSVSPEELEERILRSGLGLFKIGSEQIDGMTRLSHNSAPNLYYECYFLLSPYERFQQFPLARLFVDIGVVTPDHLESTPFRRQPIYPVEIENYVTPSTFNTTHFTGQMRREILEGKSTVLKTLLMETPGRFDERVAMLELGLSNFFNRRIPLERVHQWLKSLNPPDPNDEPQFVFGEQLYDKIKGFRIPYHAFLREHPKDYNSIGFLD
ncbi:MAG: hypothetical protein ABII01_06250 [Candidatus Woesearchaeota archaeon]